MQSILVCLLLLIACSFAQHDFAVYTLTQGTPNQVTVLAGNETGGVKVVNKVNTGGNGVPAGSPRGLESQHPLVVSQNYLFTVNTGSGSVSMFTINPSDPTQITLLDTQSSGGDWPLSLAVYSNWVCVANGGPTNGIRCFTFSASGLTILTNSDRSFGLNLTLPPVFHTGPAQVSFVPDGSGIVVSIKSNNPPLFLWTISSNQIAASPVTASTFGNVPFGFQIDLNDKTTLVLTDPAPTDAGLSGVGLVTVQTGASPAIFFAENYTLIPDQHAACWIEQSPITGHFFVANSGSNDISEISRNGNTLTVVKDYPVASTISPTDMAVAEVGMEEFLFAQSSGTELLVFSLAGGPGNAQLIQTVDLQATTTYGGGVAVYVSSTAPNTTSSSSSSSTSSSSTSTSATSTSTSTSSTTSSATLLSAGLLSFVLAFIVAAAC